MGEMRREQPYRSATIEPLKSTRSRPWRASRSSCCLCYQPNSS